MGMWDRIKEFFASDGSTGPVPVPGAGQPGPTSVPPAYVPPTPKAYSAPAQGPAQSANANAYAANPEILGLSADEMRKRALKIVPWRTAFIGRVDLIPPQSDERTALIDRGLVL